MVVLHCDVENNKMSFHSSGYLQNTGEHVMVRMANVQNIRIILSCFPVTRAGLGCVHSLGSCLESLQSAAVSYLDNRYVA